MLDTQRRALHQRFLPNGDPHAYIWKYAQSTGGRRPRHFHAEPELNLVVRGSATFGVGDGVAHVSAGELLVFPSGQDHVLLEGSPDLYLYAIGVSPTCSADALDSRRGPVVPLHVRLRSHDLAPVLADVAAAVERSGAEELIGELWDRLHWLGRRSVERANGGTHVLTRRALELMATAPELDLDALARHLRAHPSEVSRRFHRDVGTTLVRHRTRLRLLHFIRLIDGCENNLTTAADAAGFGSYSQCHRAFHSELGCGPRQFFFSGARERMQLAYLDEGCQP
jgi:AraC-like DNA-binding protein/quercetin dioxygenase-like cupin family protein